MTGKRTRIINDPSDLVPLLQAFGSNVHKKIFDELSRDWHTERELTLLVGDEASVHRSVALLRKSGLIETKWRVPEPGLSPIQLAKLKGRERRRAGGPRKRAPAAEK